MKKLLTLGLFGILSLLLLAGCSGKGKDSSEIVIVTREDGSGTRGAFVELTGIEEKTSDGGKVDRTSKEAITQMKTSTVLTSVEGNKDSIGYVSTGSLNDSVKALNIDGVAPTSENVKNSSYKIARPFNIATKGGNSDLAEDFIDFIMSKEGQEVVSDNYIAINDGFDSFTGGQASGKIIIAGSSSVTPVMEKLREAYLEVNPSGEIEIQQSDSSAGMTAVLDGTADIGMASRNLKDSERKELTDLAFALDGIAVIVHKENPVSNLSIEEVKDIFIGEIIEWNGIE